MKRLKEGDGRDQTTVPVSELRQPIEELRKKLRASQVTVGQLTGQVMELTDLLAGVVAKADQEKQQARRLKELENALTEKAKELDARERNIALSAQHATDELRRRESDMQRRENQMLRSHMETVNGFMRVNMFGDMGGRMLPPIESPSFAIGRGRVCEVPYASSGMEHGSPGLAYPSTPVPRSPGVAYPAYPSYPAPNAAVSGVAAEPASPPRVDVYSGSGSLPGRSRSRAVRFSNPTVQELDSKISRLRNQLK